MKQRVWAWMIALLCSAVWLGGCATLNARTARTFLDWAQLSKFERGGTTRRDVQRVLGAPDGSGHALLPTDATALDLWYYADIEITGTTQATTGFRGKVRQQALIVAFRGDLFEGYMWWSNEGATKR